MAHIPIHDPEDPRIVAYTGLRDHDLRLQREAPGGALDGVFLAEGDIVVERALQAGFAIRSALIDATRTKPIPTLVPAETPVFTAGPAVVQRITGMAMHRGMMAVFARRAPALPDAVLSTATRVVVLERVVNPTNLGIIARSARGLGADALLLDPTSVDPLYRRASRVAMGEIFGLPYARLDPFPDGLDVLHAHGFSLVALTPAPDATAIDELAFAPDEKVALVLGSEGPGLTDATMDRIGQRVRIPLHGGVDSLNVAAAAAIACYMLGRGR